MRGAAIGAEQEVIFSTSQYINTTITCYGSILDWIEFYDQDNKLLGHFGNIYSCTTDYPANLWRLSPKTLLYFEGKAVIYTNNGQEISICALRFHFLYNN